MICDNAYDGEEREKKKNMGGELEKVWELM